MSRKRKIVFLTGTRADFGKLKSLIGVIEQSDLFEAYIFVTGMHTLSKYGSTFHEVEKQKYKNIFVYMNQAETTEMDIILSNTVVGFSNFVKEIKPDLIIVHGDRVESLAGAIVGSFNNILVAHVEGGELSGTVDELIRHSITKLSHVHFVSNKKAEKRLMQMGENKNSIFIIGSPDIDIMKAENLPEIENVKQYYDIFFKDYALFIYHPVTTEIKNLKNNINEVVTALIDSKKDYIVIYPNNDSGSDIILDEYKRIQKNNHFKIYPSLKFEYFLALLKHSKFIIGNSSAGIGEAEVYGIPSINIGSRQNNRTKNENIINVKNDKNEIIKAINLVGGMKIKPMSCFGDGDSAEKFYDVVTNQKVWKTNIQKQFLDL